MTAYANLILGIALGSLGLTFALTWFIFGIKQQRDRRRKARRAAQRLIRDTIEIMCKDEDECTMFDFILRERCLTMLPIITQTYRAL